MNGSSHAVFGVAGAAVIDSFLHVSGPAVFGGSTTVTGALIAEKLVFYGFAALGALTPDIDNARSTLGKKLGPISKGIQHVAGHRRFFHSIIGLLVMGALIWGAQYGIGVLLYRTGADAGARQLGEALAGSALGIDVAKGAGIAFTALLIGYFLHLVADSLTIGGVPWLWPSRVRFGFPPNHKWRFKSGTWVEKVVVALVCIAVVAGIFTGYLSI